jgi:hypothetical protein
MGKSLIPDRQRAPLVRRAFEDYATGQYTKQELLNLNGPGRGSSRIDAASRSRRKRSACRCATSCTRESWTCPSTALTASAATSKLISEQLFYRVQAILSGRVPSTAPRKRAHPDLPLRGFVRCESCGCGRGLTGSWSKGRSEYYAYYHCRPGCRAVNVTTAKLEGLFADELALLQRTPGYMRLLKESVLQIWKARKAAVREELASAERAAKAIQDKLDRVGAGVTRTPTAVPTTVLSGRNHVRRKSLYWNRRNGTGFSYLREIRTENEELVDQTGIEPVTS